MAVVKTLRLVRHHRGVKYIVFASVHDRAVPETVIVGPVRYFTRRALVITSRNISETEVDWLVSKVLSSDVRCHRCGYRGEYLKVHVKDGEPDLDTAECGDCDPSAAYSLALYEAIDIAFIETRDN
jgi:hypothetical protein